MSVDPGEMRQAVVGGYASGYLLSQMASGAKVTRASVRAHAQVLREQGRHGLAHDVEASWRQLLEAAAGHRRAADWHRAQRVDIDAAAGFVNETAPAKLAPLRSESSPDAAIRDAALTTSEVANMLGVTPQYVGQIIKAGVLPARKVGRSWLVSRESVETFQDVRSAG